MQDLVYFLGRFHVLALHLPIGMVLLTALVHWLSPRHSPREQVLPLLWGITALSAILTVALGLLHFSEGGFDGPSGTAHRAWGIGFTAGTVIVWFICLFNIRLYREWGGYACLLLLVAVTMTGHYGGNLTHGSTYLVEYAPQGLRNLAGMAPQREAVTTLMAADPYLDVVAPMLDQHCGNCHNADKQRGQLDLSSLDALMVGGESGAVVLPGNARGSDLYRRVTLPQSHDDFMPAEGKTPLTESQVQILGWWIDAGLPVNTTLGSVGPNQEITALLAVELGLASPPLMPAARRYPAVSETVLANMTDLGWLVRPLAADSNGLVIGVWAPGQPVTREMLEALSSAADAVVELNMASAGLHDDMLAALSDMPALEVLNVSNNGIGDEGLAIIGGYNALRVLNLYGNPAVTDAGLARLAALENLESLYVWGTATTTEGSNALQAALPDLVIHGQSITAEAVGP